tara:strand:+ start:2136 stop:2456 length:321 start_codon:yes stop_codon:yes gene_type:complete
MNRNIGKTSKLDNVHTNNEHYGKPMQLTTLLPKITRDSGDTIITAKVTDRLDLLAKKYYGKQNLWWVIALANNLPGDSFFIEPGTQLFLPRNFTKIQNSLREQNRE